MSFIVEERPSDSPYIETITWGRTAGRGSEIRPAESHWHMVFTRLNGKRYTFLVGPWTTSGAVAFTEGAEILWIKFKLGAFMPHLPVRDLLNMEQVLPEATSHAFWLKGSAWQFPDHDNAETFINRLVQQEVLVRDPAVEDALGDRLPEMPARTLREHFLRAAGMSHAHIRQIERAQQATALLERGHPILDTVFELGFFDQPHLTRSLKQFTGYTPAQIPHI